MLWVLLDISTKLNIRVWHFFYGLFYVAASFSYCMASNGRIIREWWSGKKRSWRSRPIITAFACRDWGKRQNLSEDSRCPSRDSNQAPENKSRTLPLRHPARSWQFWYRPTCIIVCNVHFLHGPHYLMSWIGSWLYETFAWHKNVLNEKYLHEEQGFRKMISY
jgi:hypothetical protein